MASKSLLALGRNVNILKVVLTSPARQIATTRNILNNSVRGISEPNFVKRYFTSGSPIPIVSYEEIKQLHKQPSTILIDVREPKELEETGQIPTSINIPLGQVAEELASTVDADVFKAKYGRDKPQKSTEIIFHCKSGKRSQSAAEISQSLGYKNTKNYLGSWMEWAEKEGLPK